MVLSIEPSPPPPVLGGFIGPEDNPQGPVSPPARLCGGRVHEFGPAPSLGSSHPSKGQAPAATAAGRPASNCPCPWGKAVRTPGRSASRTAGAQPYPLARDGGRGSGMASDKLRMRLDLSQRHWGGGCVVRETTRAHTRQLKH